MTVEPEHDVIAGLTEHDVLANLTGMLLEVTGEDEQWAAAVAPASRLEGDLRLESVELTYLGQLVRDRYGDGVDLQTFIASLDIDQIIALTAGDLAGYIARRMAGTGTAGTGR